MQDPKGESMLMPSKESLPLNSAFASNASNVGSRVAAATTSTERRDLSHLMLSAGQQLGREWEWLLPFSTNSVGGTRLSPWRLGTK